MDGLDLGILKILLVNNGVPPGIPVLRKSFRSIAKDLGVDQGTVRTRMRRFQEQRVLRGWYLGVSPGLRGRDLGNAWLRVEEDSDKSRVVNALLTSPDVERVCNYLGPRLSLLFLVEKGIGPGSSLGKLMPMAGPGVTLTREGIIPVPDYELKETDSSIIGSLGQDPWKPYSRVAEEVGISTRTLARRISKLSEAGAIYMLPDIDLKAIQGLIPIELGVEYDSPGSRAGVNRLIVSHIGPELVFSDNSGPFGYFALAVPNLSRMDELARWVSQLEGVQGARVDALQDVILNRSHYESWGMRMTGARRAEEIRLR